MLKRKLKAIILSLIMTILILVINHSAYAYNQVEVGNDFPVKIMGNSDRKAINTISALSTGASDIEFGMRWSEEF